MFKYTIMVVSALICALLFTGISEASVCGDGVCDEHETGDTCVLDCAIRSVQSTEVGKLTGEGSNNFDGLNAKVQGTDYGYQFDHEGKMFFLFGDTEIVRCNAPVGDPTGCEVTSSTLAGTIARTEDLELDASGRPKFDFLAIAPDTYSDFAEFYAQESVLQANECNEPGCTTPGCCSEISYI